MKKPKKTRKVWVAVDEDGRLRDGACSKSLLGRYLHMYHCRPVKTALTWEVPRIRPRWVKGVCRRCPARCHRHEATITLGRQK